MVVLTREITMPPISKRQALIDAFRSKIASGEWPPGHRLPSRPKLMAEYKVSITTLRSAQEYMRDVTHELESLPSVGYFVPERPPKR